MIFTFTSLNVYQRKEKNIWCSTFVFIFYVGMSVSSKRRKKKRLLNKKKKETCDNNNNFSLVLNKTRHIQHISYRSTTINMLFFFVKRRRRCRIELNRLNSPVNTFCIIEHTYTLSWSTVLIVLSMMIFIVLCLREWTVFRYIYLE